MTIRAHFSVPLVWSRANLEACHAESRRIEPVHFFLAVLSVLDRVHPLGVDASEISRPQRAVLSPLIERGKERLGLSDEELTRLRRALRRNLVGETPGKVTGLLHRSVESRELMARAAKLASDRSADEMDFLDILEEILRHIPSEVRPFWKAKGAPDFPSVERPDISVAARGQKPTAEDRGVLQITGRDLSAAAGKGLLAPVVGREAEIDLLIRYLQRTVKRNVIVVGQAGVGKTALVEGLAQKLAGADAPAPFRALRIVQISAADLMADTKYRGDLERRIRDLVRDV